MTISYENRILNKSMILHLYNYAKEKVLKSFDMNSSIHQLKFTCPWTKVWKLTFPWPKFTCHGQREIGILEHCLYILCTLINPTCKFVSGYVIGTCNFFSLRNLKKKPFFSTKKYMLKIGILFKHTYLKWIQVEICRSRPM